MALTITTQADIVVGPERQLWSKVVGDTSYPSGGYPLTATLFGLNSFMKQKLSDNVVYPVIVGGGAASAQLLADVDGNGNLRFYYPSGGGAASPAALANPAVSAGATAMTSSAANGANDLTPGQGKEVATATNLSTVSVLTVTFGH